MYDYLSLYTKLKEKDRKENLSQGFLYLLALKQEHRIQGYALEPTAQTVFP